MSGYLRRYRLEPRRSHGRLVAGVLVLMVLLFAKAWQSIDANALSMERDRLRREVRVLENRIRLSSELRVQAALREGLDHQALAALGFQNPDPAAVVNIDLSRTASAMPGRGEGVVARFSGLVRGFQRERQPRAEELHALPVSSPVPSEASSPRETR
ncbi:MAG: hypothetical protein AAB011_06155 [Candidatus Eisenbacteria bacterium]